MGLSLAHPLWPGTAVAMAAALLVLLGWWSRRPRPGPSDSVLVAHTAALRTLARYRVLARRHRLGALVRLAAAVTIVSGTTLVLIRPQAVAVEPRVSRSRDIMLCLDASGSMDRYDGAVVEEARQIVAHLHGDRIGMMIWSGAAVLVFPLTDDYGYVDAQLDRAERAFGGQGAAAFYAGVDLAGRRASLIGDGVVSCVNRFDRLQQQRTRAVIVASDNEPIGTPAYTLPAAARYAKARHVLLYGIGAGSLGTPARATARQQFADATATTGGTFALLDSSGAAAGIIDRIDDLERARAQQPPRQVSHDESGVGVLVAGTGLGLLVLTWSGDAWSLVRRKGRR